MRTRAVIAGALLAGAGWASAQQAPQPAAVAVTGGPNCHQVHTAISTDAKSFHAEGQLLDRASVPDGVKLPDGTLGVYYVNGADHGIYLGRQTGTRWDRGQRILLDGVFDQNAVDPDAVVLFGDRVRLFYYKGSFIGGAPPAPGGLSTFYSASSRDGVNFTVEGKVFEIAGGTDPSAVLLSDGNWILAVARAQQQEIVIARSPDGMKFETVATLKNAGIPELVRLDDGQVRLLFNGQGGMQSRVSEDGGRTWVDEPGNRLDYPGFAADPSVIRLAFNQWRMFFKTADQACEDAARQAMGAPVAPGQPQPPRPLPQGQQVLPPLPGQPQPGPIQGVPKGPPPLGNAK